jgi:hypothetical protein
LVEGRFGWARALLRAAIFVAARLSAGAVGAQTNTAEIAGIIRDQQGSRLPGATVAAVHLESRTRVQATTDQQGRYLLPALLLGTHEVTVELSGFKRVLRTPVAVALGERLQLDFELEIGGLAESITVSGDPPLLQVNTAEISDIVANEQILQMPLNTRDVLALAQLSDAVVLPPGGTRGEALQQAGPLPNVGGQRSGHNIYLLDGVKVTDELFNNLVITPSPDSVQEFKIQKSQYAAEFGGKASALINVATRAGTNQLHGSAFEFLRHEAFDSRGYFDPDDQDVPSLRQHQFGGTAGGPLARNKTFFFGSYEGQRLRREQTRTFSVPSEAARRGSLGAVQIDPARIDPLSAALLQYVPLPNRPGELQNLVAIEDQQRDRDAFSVRLDHQVTPSGHLFGRFSTFDADEVQPFGTSALQEVLVPGFGRRVNTRARNAGVSHTQILDESWLNELRFGWMTAAGRDYRPARRRFSAGLDARALQHLRRPDVDGHARQPAFRDLRQPAARSRAAPREVRRLSVPPAAPARAARQRARVVHLHGPVLRRRLRRLPPRRPHQRGVRHRPRRRGRPDDVVPPVRARRLARR